MAKRPSETKKKATVSAVLPKSPLAEHNLPLLHKVATEIIVDDPMFIPEYCDSNTSVVNLVANPSADASGAQRVALGHRCTVVIDCGFSMQLPDGYRAVIKSRSNLAERGLIVSDGPGVIDVGNNGRVTVTVTNVGKEIIVIEKGDLIAQMWIEPIFLFDWMVKTLSG